jgi:hypothetical protein
VRASFFSGYEPDEPGSSVSACNPGEGRRFKSYPRYHLIQEARQCAGLFYSNPLTRNSQRVFLFVRPLPIGILPDPRIRVPVKAPGPVAGVGAVVAAAPDGERFTCLDTVKATASVLYRDCPLA